MEPIAVWVRGDGEWALVHRCLRCFYSRSRGRTLLKSEITDGVAVSKPTTSSIPPSAGSAIENPLDTIPTTTSFVRRKNGRSCSKLLSISAGC